MYCQATASEPLKRPLALWTPIVPVYLVVVVVQCNESPLKQHAICVEVFLVANEVKVFPKVKKTIKFQG